MQTTKTKQSLPKPSLLLKDYLIRDDLSSCSSNGFKSFPRQQCCSTVGLILVDKKKDLKLRQRKRRRSRRTNNKNTLLLPQLPRSTSYFSCSSSKVSVLQRASKAVINAIKSSLPLNGSDKKTVAAASGILSRSFWWKSAKKEESVGGEGTQRWRTSFRELLMQDRDETTTSFNEDSVVSVSSAPSSSSTTITTSSSGSDSNNSWGESEFTFSSSSAASSESSAENDVADGAKEVAQRDKIEEATKDWVTNEEKEEQFSPVSVLDCPFQDDEGIAPHFNSTTHSLLEGTEHKNMQKRRHFESVASVEPMALEKRMSWSELEDEPHNNSTENAVLVPIKCTQNDGNTNMPHCNIEENAIDLLNLVKRSIPSNLLIIKAENLLFDYFKQSFMENSTDIDHNQSKKLQLFKEAEDWINGQPQEVYLGWEVQEGRQVYIKEMDKCVKWRNNDQEVQQLALELENNVFSSLVNEIILDHLTIC